uniref:Uncharacterized protein n=1 Tax=Oryza punctata TaxID=4537 RepID=A0A0E0KH59_ORYPU
MWGPRRSHADSAATSAKTAVKTIKGPREENLQCDMIFPTIRRPKSSWIMGAKPKPLVLGGKVD